MPLVDQPFSDTFTFSRRRAAAYGNWAGIEAIAAKHEPRFDHNSAGIPRGLIIEGRSDQWFPDRLEVRSGDWSSPAGTVLHTLEDIDGQLRHMAWYAPVDPISAVNACLNAKGYHHRIAYVPVYLRNRGGFVRWRRTDYVLGGLLKSETGVVLAAAADVPLLEG